MKYFLVLFWSTKEHPGEYDHKMVIYLILTVESCGSPNTAFNIKPDKLHCIQDACILK